MVISASYKTDIPAFYGSWFLNRLDAGYCWVKNPVSGRPFYVSMRREDVDGIVFWTKNPWPFLSAADKVRELGFPFYFQFTITGYGEQVEKAVLPVARAIEGAKRLVDVHGPGTVVWRYDPIIVSEAMPLDAHVDHFAGIAEALEGYVDEVATKFLVLHVKTRRNLTAAIGETWRDPSPQEKASLVRELSAQAESAGMKLTLCSQPEIRADVPASVCIDAGRLTSRGAAMLAPKVNGNRPGCRCIDARDIGDYDTCPQGCAYCYATQRQSLAIERHRLHDPNGESLLPMSVPLPNLAVIQASLF